MLVFKTYAEKAVKILVIIILINGFVDTIYFIVKPGLSIIKQYLITHVSFLHRKHTVKLQSTDPSFNEIKENLEYVFYPGLGRLLKPISHPGIEIDTTSQRLSPSIEKKNVQTKGILLGASQVFGWFSKSDETLSEYLNSFWPEVGFLNYGQPGQQIANNMMFLQHLIEQKVQFDFVILFGGPSDILYHYAQYNTIVQNRQTGLSDALLPRIVNISKRILWPFVSSNSSTTEPIGIQQSHTIINRIIYELKNAIHFCNERKIPIYVIIPPMPYNHEWHKNPSQYPPNALSNIIAFTPLYETLSLRLLEQPIPGLLDLSQYLDNSNFFDVEGHLTNEGHRKLAKEILHHLKKDISTNLGLKTKTGE